MTGAVPLPRPEALLLDLDGVLVDIAGRRALAAADDVAALAALRPLAVVTSCPLRLAESVLTRHGFRAHVQALVVAEDGPGKPDPFPVRLALRRLGAASAWFLGDNPSDAQAAIAAGVVALAIAPRGRDAEARAARLLAAGAVCLLPDLAALRALLAAG